MKSTRGKSSYLRSVWSTERKCSFIIFRYSNLSANSMSTMILENSSLFSTSKVKKKKRGKW